MRTLPAPSCPRCGSTDTYFDAIEVSMSGDVPPYPVIAGAMHCRAYERGQDVDLHIGSAVAGDRSTDFWTVVETTDHGEPIVGILRTKPEAEAWAEAYRAQFPGGEPEVRAQAFDGPYASAGQPRH